MSTKARFPNSDYALVTENGENTKLSFYYGEDLGMPYIENKNNLDEILIYDMSTRSIPAQTTPKKVIVLCAIS